MDDSADKTRRNLMAFATGVIAIYWFDMPLVGNLFGIAHLENISPVKAWISALVVLSYLLLRFHLSPTTTKERLPWIQGHKAMLTMLYQKSVDRSARDFVAKKKSRIQITLLSSPAIDSKLKQVIPSDAANQTIPRKAEFTILFNVRSNGVALFGTPMDSIRGTASVGMIELIRLHASALKDSLWMKWTPVEILLPYMLGVIAIIISIAKLGAHVLD